MLVVDLRNKMRLELKGLREGGIATWEETPIQAVVIYLVYFPEQIEKRRSMQPR
jgi:hypothetical protein